MTEKTMKELVAPISSTLYDLNENETYIFKRGRNAKSGTVPKHADLMDYRMATGFEALIGYLYLIGDTDRLEFIFNTALSLDLQ